MLAFHVETGFDSVCPLFYWYLNCTQKHFATSTQNFIVFMTRIYLLTGNS